MGYQDSSTKIAIIEDAANASDFLLSGLSSVILRDLRT